jgi:hypothetical protein
MALPKILIIVACSFVVVLALAMILGRQYAANELVRAKPYITYKRLMYLASGCDSFRKDHDRWPYNMEELKKYRKDLEECSKDGFGNNITLLPYDSSSGYGILRGQGTNQTYIEVRFPLGSNSNWNETVGSTLVRPRLRP